MDKLEQGKISSIEQVFMLLITLVVSTAILFVPGITAENAGQDGWISLLIVATFYGILVVLIVTALAKRFPGMTLVQYSEVILGKYLGKLLGLLYIFWFLSINSVIVREFSDFILTSFMPETPVIVFSATLLLLGISAVRNGIEVIARVNTFVGPLMFISLTIIAIIELEAIKLENLTPIFENGIEPILRGSLGPSAFRGEVILLAMLIPYVNQPEKTRKSSIAAVVAIGIFLAIDAAITVAVLGVDLTANQTFPTFILARYIRIAGFLEQVEAIVMLMWVMGVVIKVAIFYYVAVLATAQVFNLKSYQPVILPIALILGAWSIAFFDHIKAVKDFIGGVFPPYAITFEFLIPLVLLTIAILRRQRRSEKP